MNKFVFAAAAGALFASPAWAADSPAEGTWAVEARTDFGTLKSDWMLAEADGAWTLEMKDQPMEGGPGGPPPESTIADLKVEGNTLTFNRSLDIGGQAMSFSYTATVDGDSLTGEVKSDLGPIPISGTRK